MEKQALLYYQYLKSRGYHSSTCRTRYLNLLQFINFIKKHHIKRIDQLESTHLGYYKKHLQNTISDITANPLHPQTIYNHLQCINLFLEYLKRNTNLEHNVCNELILKYPKYESYQREILSKTEIQILYQTTEKIEEKLLLDLGYGCGLRVSELVAINTSDIYLKEGLLIIPRGKLNKRRMIPLVKEIKQNIESYLVFRSSSSEALLLNTKGNRMQQWSYNAHLKKMLHRIGIPKERIQRLSMHSLRHSIASHLLDKGMSLERVSHFLGHSHLETTEIYTHIKQEYLRKCIV